MKRTPRKVYVVWAWTWCDDLELVGTARTYAEALKIRDAALQCVMPGDYLPSRYERTLVTPMFRPKMRAPNGAAKPKPATRKRTR